MTKDNDQTRRVRGQVKWFDPVKGYGFVVADKGGPDILLHANVLRNFGQSSVADRAGIELDVQTTERGMQAVAVHRIDPPDQDRLAGLADLAEIDPEVIRAAPLEPARVKWFDKGKGFGFANTFGCDKDVFIHIEVLRRSGMADLQPGEALAIRVIEGGRGRMATEVCGWESGGQAIRGVTAACVLWLVPVLAASAAPACHPDAVHLRGDWGTARFSVEVADEPDERAQGLMHVESMPRSVGMLFVYDSPRTARFWMKNTVIPLDILFADATGTVRRIKHMAEPGSERLIPGGGGIQYVLEINGGMARAMGITKGTVLRHPAIAGERAAWPC